MQPMPLFQISHVLLVVLGGFTLDDRHVFRRDADDFSGEQFASDPE
jgi:hypothetical protein